MKKLGTFLLIILISALLAAIYGALHDQVTYTISSEYFTVFKFDQFGFTDWGHKNPRATTALIGILATWWVGLFIGIFQGLIGFIHKTPKLMFQYAFKAVLITLGITIIFGFVGYLTEKFNPTAYPDCCSPYTIKDGKSFRIVGSIHNYSYAGGEIGAFIGIAYQIIMKRKTMV
ncbi:hypothetical protein [Flavobacterium terrisoli]|uniref:hypothetical protein n=1 Tax=Flavobacterium terrisoli TaxID=3242195 RepID=UPI00254355DB|nr:hypothetical protein [Flavobacterium buctense]